MEALCESSPLRGCSAEVPEPWPSLLAGGQILAALLLSTSFSEKYRGRHMRPGDVAELCLPAGFTRAHEDVRLRVEQRKAILLSRCETDGKEAAAFIWAGTGADKTVYVTFAPLRLKRQLWKIRRATLRDEFIKMSDHAGGADRIRISSYVSYKLYQLQGRGLQHLLAEALLKHPGHRLLFAGISHGAALAQAAAFQFRLVSPTSDVLVVTWNGYRWTDAAGSQIVGRVLGPNMLPLALSRQRGDGVREWDSVVGFPAHCAPMLGFRLLDSGTGDILSCEAGSPYLLPSYLSLDFARRAKALHFASGAIVATRRATMAALAREAGSDSGCWSWGSCSNDSTRVPSQAEGENEEVEEGVDQVKDDTVTERTDNLDNCATVSIHETTCLYSWTELSRGLALPVGALRAGADAVGAAGIAFIARNRAGEAGKVTLAPGPGPAVMQSILCPIVQESLSGDVFVLSAYSNAIWMRVRRGDRLPDGAVLAGITPGGCHAYVARDEAGEAGTAWCPGHVDVADLKVEGFAFCNGQRFAAAAEVLVVTRAAGELRVEIVGAEGLADPTYRLGDVVGRLVGLCSLKPYVEVIFGGRSCRTGYQKAPSGSASFDEVLRFPLLYDIGDITLRAVDRRVSQIGGDAPIGEGTVALDMADAHGEVRVVEMMRNGTCHGYLHVRTSATWRPVAEDNAEIAEKTETPSVEEMSCCTRSAPDRRSATWSDRRPSTCFDGLWFGSASSTWLRHVPPRRSNRATSS